MRTFQTNNRAFIIEIMTTDHCSQDCCSGVIISTLSKYLRINFIIIPITTFFRLPLVAISLFAIYCIHVRSSGGRESSLFIIDAG